eukprot:scaffold21867_cov48-Phaeocystis_antarctica.AAC.2
MTTSGRTVAAGVAPSERRRKADGGLTETEAPAERGVPGGARITDSARPEPETRCLRSRGMESACSWSEVGTRMAVALPLLPGMPPGVVPRGVPSAGERATPLWRAAGDMLCSARLRVASSCFMSYSISAASCLSRERMSCRYCLWSRSSSRRKRKRSRSSGE